MEPGVITADLHKKAEKAGLFYPPDPSSSSVSTIGGNLADSCHLRNVQKVVSQPKELLCSIPGVQYIELPGADGC